MSIDSSIVTKVYILLQEAIYKKEINVSSAMHIVAKGMELMAQFTDLSGSQKRGALILVLEKIADGADGMSGTDDDLIPKATIDTLKGLLQTDIISQTITIIKDAANGKFNFEATLAVASEVKDVVVPGVFACFSCIFKNTKKATTTTVTAAAGPV